ncbi:hypothetical protein CEXT_754781 [Caerostris extrusa]|uniref:Uncharacterized protein n=1 Tax=Caerostris extrusa TaxID=172846 RepID=A0AAV4Q9U0_CAEEX|nr:hypothetical protein CEXT_754781 [Caerostris extrusa]
MLSNLTDEGRCAGISDVLKKREVREKKEVFKKSHKKPLCKVKWVKWTTHRLNNCLIIYKSVFGWTLSRRDCDPAGLFIQSCDESEENLSVRALWKVENLGVVKMKRGILCLFERWYAKDKLSTQVRMVFNCSSCAKGNLSLNDCLDQGPNLNPSVLDIILDFENLR